MFSVMATDNANPGTSASAVVTVGSVTTTTTAVTTTTLAVNVQIYGRVAGVGAAAGVYDSATQEAVDDSQSSNLPDGDFVSPFSGNASATAMIMGGSAQASGGASGTTTFDAKDRFIGAGGNGSGSSSCSVAAGLTCLPTSGSGAHSFFFEVSGGSVPYSITASVSGDGNGVGRVRLSGPGGDPFNFNSQTSAGGSQSGTLGPGQYSFAGVASAPATQNSSSSAMMNYQFTLGPLP
jgi:hypothetical protein